MAKYIISAVELALFILAVYIMLKQQTKGKWPWNTESENKRGPLIGSVFGILGIAFIEISIYLFDQMVSITDTMIVTVGLLLDPVAGIVTGIFIAMGWLIGSNGIVMTPYIYASAASAAIGGVIAFLVKKYLSEGKRVPPLHCVMTYIVVGALHLLALIATSGKSDSVDLGFIAIRYLAMSDVIVNIVSIVIVSVMVAVINKDKLRKDKKETSITELIQMRIILAIIVAFAVTSVITIKIEEQLCIEQGQQTMNYALYDVSEEIKALADEVVKDDATAAADYIKSGGSITDALNKFNASEINIINSSGTVTASTVPERVGCNVDNEDSYVLAIISESDYVSNATEARYNENAELKYVDIKDGDRFIELGYDSDYFQPYIEDAVRKVATNRHVGSTGYMVVLDDDWKIVSADQYFIEALGTDYFSKRTDERNTKEENVLYETTIKDTDYIYMISNIEGYSVSAMYPVSAAYELAWKSVCLSLLLQIVVYAILYVLIYFSLKKIVIGNIHKVNASLSQIADGKLEEKVDVYTSIEFTDLSDDINLTVDALKGYIAEAASRIDEELKFARDIQSAALPHANPAFPDRTDFEIYAIMNAAKEVGGDFYDFMIVHKYILTFLVADVSGKSIPGAMFMMKAKSTIKHLREIDCPADETFVRANDELCDGNDAGMFVTAWMGVVDLKSGILNYSNAGHNPPLIKRVGGKWEYLKSRANFVLAGMEGSKYTKHELKLEPGDEILLYTDGVTEATNINNELLGEERLLDFINSCEYSDMNTLVEKIRKEVMDFTGEAEQFDDITILGFKFIGNEPVLTIRDEDATIDDIPRVTEQVDECLSKMGCPTKARIQLDIAIDEFYSNIAKYAYGGRPGAITVTLEKTQEKKGVILSFLDDGVAFNPFARKNPDVTLSAEERKIGGLGIFMVKNQMDDLFYEYRDDRNIVRLIKYFEK